MTTVHSARTAVPGRAGQRARVLPHGLLAAVRQLPASPQAAHRHLATAQASRHHRSPVQMRPMALQQQASGPDSHGQTHPLSWTALRRTTACL